MGENERGRRGRPVTDALSDLQTHLYFIVVLFAVYTQHCPKALRAVSQCKNTHKSYILEVEKDKSVTPKYI